MKIARLLLILVLGLTLVACGSPRSESSSNSGIANAKSQPTATLATAIQAKATQVKTNTDDLVRTDGQGAVEITVQPINLVNPNNSIVFEVSMNTHSVDLSMDLGTLATLSTDNGYSVLPVAWDGAQGGHHVSGNLSFPAEANGKAILDGAKTITLTIKDVDASERAFVWDVNQ